MARSIEIIQSEIIANIKADSRLSEITSGSKVALWRLWTFIVASTAHVLEKLFDAHRDEISIIIAQQKPHTIKWYVEKAKYFRYGQVLLPDLDIYDDTGLDVGQIEVLQIVKEAAVIGNNGSLLIKVATKDGSGNLIPLSVPQYNAFVGYINEVKDAGVAIQVLTFAGDRIRITIDVFYDSSVLGPDGSRLDGSIQYPVKAALLSFFNKMPFDGHFAKPKLVDALQFVEGVVAPEVRFILAAKADTANWSSVDVFYKPYSGYFTIDETELTINYIAA